MHKLARPSWPMLALAIFWLKKGLAGSRDRAHLTGHGDVRVCKLLVEHFDNGTEKGSRHANLDARKKKLAEPASHRLAVIAPIEPRACSHVLETASLPGPARLESRTRRSVCSGAAEPGQENGVQTAFCRQKQVVEQRDCGQAAEYPQDRMCRNAFTEDKPFFLQHPCKADTILVQPVRAAVNR